MENKFMDGIAFKDNSKTWKNKPWKNLIHHLSDEFNSYIWLYDCQACWDTSDFDYDAIDEILERCLMHHPNFEMTSTNIIKKGHFLSIFSRLNIDEWTYLLGFKCEDEDLDYVLKRPSLTNYLSQECFEMLVNYDGILIIFIDGWWECFPADHVLIKYFNKNLLTAQTNIDKWMQYEQDYTKSIFPDFNENPIK